MKNEMTSPVDSAANGPARRQWITPEIQDASVVGVTGKTSDQIEAGDTFKLGS